MDKIFSLIIIGLIFFILCDKTKERFSTSSFFDYLNIIRKDVKKLKDKIKKKEEEEAKNNLEQRVKDLERAVLDILESMIHIKKIKND